MLFLWGGGGPRPEITNGSAVKADISLLQNALQMMEKIKEKVMEGVTGPLTGVQADLH